MLLLFERSGNRYTLKDLYPRRLIFIPIVSTCCIVYQLESNFTSCYRERLEELNLKLKKSELAARLLNRVEDIAIVDSQVVNKTDFLRYYKFSKELGTLTQQRLLLRKNQAQDKVTYTTQRGATGFVILIRHVGIWTFTSVQIALMGWSAPASISKNINRSTNENIRF